MEIPALLCEDIVFRGVKKRFFDATTKTAMAFAFIRRPVPADAKGLSVNHHCAPTECALGFTKLAIFSLHVGRVRDLNLDIVPNTPTHANIEDLPRPEDSTDDKLRAESLADDLARQARFVLFRD